MEQVYESILEAYKKLKDEIILCADENWEIHGKEHELPFHNRMDNLIRKVKKIESLDEDFKCFLSSDSIYKKIEEETGIRRIKLSNPLTLDRLKEQVEEAKRSSFTNGNKWKFDIKNYARAHNITFEEVMHELGYTDYKSPNKNRTILSAVKNLEEWASTRKGYLDGVFGSEVEQDLRFIYKHANELDLDGSVYLMLMSDKLKFSSSRVYIDHMVVLKRRYDNYLKVHGNDVENMKRKDPTLYNMLLHEAKYAPDGSVGVNDIRAYHGFPSVGVSRSNNNSFLPMNEILEYVHGDKVEKVTSNRAFHSKLNDIVLQQGTSIQAVLASSIPYKNGMTLPRLARVEFEYSSIINEIKEDVKEAWKRMNVADDDFEKKEEIALMLYDKEIERILLANIEHERLRG